MTDAANVKCNCGHGSINHSLYEGVMGAGMCLAYGCGCEKFEVTDAAKAVEENDRMNYDCQVCDEPMVYPPWEDGKTSRTSLCRHNIQPKFASRLTAVEEPARATEADLDEMCNCGHTAEYHSGGYGDCQTCDCRTFEAPTAPGDVREGASPTPSPDHTVQVHEKVSTLQVGEDGKLPELEVTDEDLDFACEFFNKTDGRILRRGEGVHRSNAAGISEIVRTSEIRCRERQLLAALKENARMTDLVSFHRHELFTANLISMNEYTALVMDSDSGNRVARLENYDATRIRAEQAEAALEERNNCGTGFAYVPKAQFDVKVTKLEAALAIMTEDRNLWQQAHDEDCPNKAALGERDEEINRVKEVLRSCRSNYAGYAITSPNSYASAEACVKEFWNHISETDKRIDSELARLRGE